MTEEKCSQCGKPHDVTPHPSCSSIFHWDAYAQSLVRKLHAVERERDEARAERDAVRRVLRRPEHGLRLEIANLRVANGRLECESLSAEARGFEKGVRETIARVRTLDAHTRSQLVADVVTELLPVAPDKTKEGV